MRHVCVRMCVWAVCVCVCVWAVRVRTTPMRAVRARAFAVCGVRVRGTVVCVYTSTSTGTTNAPLHNSSVPSLWGH